MRGKLSTVLVLGGIMALLAGCGKGEEAAATAPPNPAQAKAQVQNDPKIPPQAKQSILNSMQRNPSSTVK